MEGLDCVDTPMIGIVSYAPLPDGPVVSIVGGLEMVLGVETFRLNDIIRAHLLTPLLNSGHVCACSEDGATGIALGITPTARPRMFYKS
jgi:hypothetical protein